MDKAQDRGRLDWLVEVAGASAPAIAAAYAAARLAPLNGWPVTSATLFGSGAMFVVAFAVMRMIPAEPRHLALPEFEAAALQEDELLLDQVSRDDSALDILLLDHLEDAASEKVAELLLDDPLPVPAPESRVVQLFADGRMPTAGQLKTRIDRHLADGGKAAAPAGDASDALSEALAELRRSLRQA